MLSPFRQEICNLERVQQAVHGIATNSFLSYQTSSALRRVSVDCT